MCVARRPAPASSRGAVAFAFFGVRCALVAAVAVSMSSLSPSTLQPLDAAVRVLEMMWAHIASPLWLQGVVAGDPDFASELRDIAAATRSLTTAVTRLHRHHHSSAASDVMAMSAALGARITRILDLLQ